jgi:AraC-like DNA-binding protein
MELAARRLRESDETLSVIAGRVGYASEFAFSRAFSRTFGVAPGRYRAAGRPGRSPYPASAVATRQADMCAHALRATPDSIFRLRTMANL